MLIFKILSKPMSYTTTSIRTRKKTLTLDDLHLKAQVRTQIDQLLEEFTFIDALSKLDIPIDNKILLHGHTGCGKTATAHAIGLALNKKVITINLSGFVSSKLGETAKNLADLFKEAASEKGILFIDEFDFVGKLRDYDEKDSGEMKRLVNALIQQIDHLDEHTLLICATNHINIIDTALLRRFQIKLNYELPDKEGLNSYYDSLLQRFPQNISAVKRQYGISYAEAKDVVYNQIKSNAILFEKQKMHLLFEYKAFENFQDENKKQATTPAQDYLLGYLLKTDLKSDCPRKSAEHQIAIKSSNSSDQVAGYVITVSGEELMHLDKQRTINLQRIKATTASGLEVWVYTAK